MEFESDFLHKKYLVYVRCCTYNHSAFVSEALDGFASQNTKFPYVCVIVDDCSTDGAQSIILEWMNKECDQSSIRYYESKLSYLYLANHRNNINCSYAFYLLKQNLYHENEKKELLIKTWRRNSKYEAICEGDDCWTDPNKLQEQVDFLEKHGNFSATSSQSIIIHSSPALTRPFGTSRTRDFRFIKDIIVERQFHTASVVLRISALENCSCYKKGYWDTFQWCCLLTQGPIHYDEKVTCIYRQQNQGITETTPTIKWLAVTSDWADIIRECFVPKFVRRKYVVRSVTKGIIGAYMTNYNRLTIDEKKSLRSLYCHNFTIENIFYDIKEFLKQCTKKILNRK